MVEFNIKQYLVDVLKAKLNGQIYYITNYHTEYVKKYKIWMPDNVDRLVVLDDLINTSAGIKDEILYNSHIPTSFEFADILFRDLLKISKNVE